ncbi:CoA transferase [Arthrobacter sp. APC 3897]|uniref:CoA transferase n=1 Tax=Arthrobacter sp. APC 3897 TaxID=3035204 RepID=UPI0025B55B41|nr:CoA transferase [Arthrobacter sp. APC 3897]MDN3482831.1 CoA transferase [Arthrobacter sp. APC 3897]
MTDQTPVPELWRSLEPLLPDGFEPAAWWGSRWWWGGPLDVEGLGLGALQALATAVSAYALTSGHPERVSFAAGGAAASFASFAHLRINGEPVRGFAPLSGFRRSADGWVRLHANYPHHERALLAALNINGPGEVDAEIRRRTSADVEETVTEHGGLAAAVRTPEQWAASGPGGAVLHEPWLRLDLEAAERASLPCGGSGILAGLRVLDLTRVIAGPSGSRILGSLGADVLRVDPPGIPELEDQYVDTGFSKRSTAADFGDPDAYRKLCGLLEGADVVLTAYRSTALSRFGLHTAALRADHPGVAVVSLDAWGDRGAWAGRRGFDSIVQAAAGISHLYGNTEEDGERRPGALPVQILDYATGLGMAAAAVALVAARARGLGGSAHLSLARTAVELMRLPGPPGGIKPELPEPELLTCRSGYGDLIYVPPPLLINGAQLEYRWPPPRYGSAALVWDYPGS